MLGNGTWLGDEALDERELEATAPSRWLAATSCVFMLTGDALSAWERLDDRPARELVGLRDLMDRPSQFGA